MSHFAFIVSLNLITIKFKIKFEGETWHRMEGHFLSPDVALPSFKNMPLPQSGGAFLPGFCPDLHRAITLPSRFQEFSQWSRPLRLSSQDHKWIEILTIYCHPGSGTWEPSRSGRGDSRSSRTKAFSSLPKPSPTHYLHVTSSNHVYSHTWAFMPNFVCEWAWASRERHCRWLCLASRNLSSSSSGGSEVQDQGACEAVSSWGPFSCFKRDPISWCAHKTSSLVGPKMWWGNGANA